MSKAKAIDFSMLMSKTKEFENVLLEEGLHESIIYGVIFLDEQKVQYDENVPAEFKKQMKIQVEFPLAKREDGTFVTLATKRINCTNSDKGTLYKIYAAAMGRQITGDNKLTPDELEAELEANGLSNLLGKKIGANVVHWNKGTKHKMASLSGLPGSPCELETHNNAFVFHPRFPDMEVWKNSLGYFMKRDIMSSIKAGEFPKELHDQWAIDQEENKKRQDEFAAKKEAKQSDVGDVI